MKQIIRPLIFLLATATLLLLSDLQNRNKNSKEKKVTRIALFLFASSQLQEETENGILEVLEKSDRSKKGMLEIKRFNAEGDMAVANAICTNIVSGKYDIAMTVSTPALQVMANANRNGDVIHIFSAVTDPYTSGVGITGPGADQHPPHLTGIGSFQPVEGIFRIAKQMNPELKRVGVAWCVAQTCSEACVLKAREICRELGIELVEMNVETVSQVYEAALSVCQRGVEALWIGGDNVVEPAISLYVAAASKSHIPVFTNTPRHSLKGALANLGANYFQVGQLAGNMALSILDGLPASETEVKNIVPESLFINDSIRQILQGNWEIPKELEEKADTIIRSKNP